MIPRSYNGAARAQHRETKGKTAMETIGEWRLDPNPKRIRAVGTPHGVSAVGWTLSVVGDDLVVTPPVGAASFVEVPLPRQVLRRMIDLASPPTRIARLRGALATLGTWRRRDDGADGESLNLILDDLPAVLDELEAKRARVAHLESVSDMARELEASRDALARAEAEIVKLSSPPAVDADVFTERLRAYASALRGPDAVAHMAAFEALYEAVGLDARTPAATEARREARPAMVVSDADRLARVAAAHVGHVETNGLIVGCDLCIAEVERSRLITDQSPDVLLVRVAGVPVEYRRAQPVGEEVERLAQGWEQRASEAIGDLHGVGGLTVDELCREAARDVRRIARVAGARAIEVAAAVMKGAATPSSALKLATPIVVPPRPHTFVADPCPTPVFIDTWATVEGPASDGTGVLPLELSDGTLITCDSMAGGANATDGEPNELTLRIATAQQPDRLIRYVRAPAPAASPRPRWSVGTMLAHVIGGHPLIDRVVEIVRFDGQFRYRFPNSGSGWTVESDLLEVEVVDERPLPPAPISYDQEYTAVPVCRGCSLAETTPRAAIEDSTDVCSVCQKCRHPAQDADARPRWAGLPADGAAWATKYVETHGGDFGLMLAWFANAIEIGRLDEQAKFEDATAKVQETAQEWRRLMDQVGAMQTEAATTLQAADRIRAECDQMMASITEAVGEAEDIGKRLRAAVWLRTVALRILAIWAMGTVRADDAARVEAALVLERDRLRAAVDAAPGELEGTAAEIAVTLGLRPMPGASS